MRIRRLHLKAFGPFTDQVLDFGEKGVGIVLVHGPNEAGKSSALRAICDLRFGIPAQSGDNFVHSHPDMRVGGEFVDRQGRRHSFMRRKGNYQLVLTTPQGTGQHLLVTPDLFGVCSPEGAPHSAFVKPVQPA